VDMTLNKVLLTSRQRSRSFAVVYIIAESTNVKSHVTVADT
jgi:hypothetical protein